MTMYVLIEHTPEGAYIASVMGWPTLQSQGATEDEALTQLRRSLTARLQQARIVPLELELELESVENPWLALGERFQHNPLLDEVTRSIAEYRSRLDDRSEAT